MRPPLDRRPWILGLPHMKFSRKFVRMSSRQAMKCVEAIRGTCPEPPIDTWTTAKSSRFGEDLVGGWLLRNGGADVGLRRGRRIRIPAQGTVPERIADWMLARRILVEVKTYGHVLTKGGDLGVTRQLGDYVLWRDAKPDVRAVVLARVSWRNNARIDTMLMEDLRHYKIPVLTFLWQWGMRPLASTGQDDNPVASPRHQAPMNLWWGHRNNETDALRFVFGDRHETLMAARLLVDSMRASAGASFTSRQLHAFAVELCSGSLGVKYSYHNFYSKLLQKLMRLGFIRKTVVWNPTRATTEIRYRLVPQTPLAARSGTGFYDRALRIGRAWNRLIQGESPEGGANRP